MTVRAETAGFQRRSLHLQLVRSRRANRPPALWSALRQSSAHMRHERVVRWWHRVLLALIWLRRQLISSYPCQRLAFNGWWQSSYLPASLDEDRLEWMLSSREGRRSLTGAQAQMVGEMLDDPAWKGRTDAAARRLQGLCDTFEDEIIEACGPEVLLRRLVHRS